MLTIRKITQNAEASWRRRMRQLGIPVGCGGPPIPRVKRQKPSRRGQLPLFDEPLRFAKPKLKKKTPATQTTVLHETRRTAR